MLGSPGGGQGGGHRVLWPPSTVHPQPAHQQPAHDGGYGRYGVYSLFPGAGSPAPGGQALYQPHCAPALVQGRLGAAAFHQPQHSPHKVAESMFSPGGYAFAPTPPPGSPYSPSLAMPTIPALTPTTDLLLKPLPTNITTNTPNHLEVITTKKEIPSSITPSITSSDCDGAKWNGSANYQEDKCCVKTRCACPNKMKYVDKKSGSGCSRTNPVKWSSSNVAVKREPGITPCQVAEVTTSEIDRGTVGGTVVKLEAADTTSTTTTTHQKTEIHLSQTLTNGNIPVGIAVARQRLQQDVSGSPNLAAPGEIHPLSVPSTLSAAITTSSHQLLKEVSRVTDIDVTAGMAAATAAGGTVGGALLQCTDERTTGLAAWPIGGTHTHAPTLATPTLWQYPGCQLKNMNSPFLFYTEPVMPFPVPMPPVGFQLVRDPSSGQFLLIPTASIEQAMMWPTYSQPPSHVLLPPMPPPPLAPLQLLSSPAQPTDYLATSTTLHQHTTQHSTRLVALTTATTDNKRKVPIPISGHTLIKIEADCTSATTLDHTKAVQQTVSTVSSNSGAVFTDNSVTPLLTTHVFYQHPTANLILSSAAQQTNETSCKSQATSPVTCLTPPPESLAITEDENSQTNVQDASNQTETLSEEENHKIIETIDDNKSTLKPIIDVKKTSELLEINTQVPEISNNNAEVDDNQNKIDEIQQDNEDVKQPTKPDISGLELLSNSIVEYESCRSLSTEIPVKFEIKELKNEAVKEEKEEHGDDVLKGIAHMTIKDKESEVYPKTMDDNLGGLNLLCALAEQRLEEVLEKQNEVEYDFKHYKQYKKPKSMLNNKTDNNKNKIDVDIKKIKYNENIDEELEKQKNEMDLEQEKLNVLKKVAVERELDFDFCAMNKKTERNGKETDEVIKHCICDEDKNRNYKKYPEKEWSQSFISEVERNMQKLVDIHRQYTEQMELKKTECKGDCSKKNNKIKKKEIERSPSPPLLDKMDNQPIRYRTPPDQLLRPPTLCAVVSPLEEKIQPKTNGTIISPIEIRFETAQKRKSCTDSGTDSTPEKISSSKKRKVGRPKKLLSAPGLRIATETIVAKKPKSKNGIVGFLLAAKNRLHLQKNGTIDEPPKYFEEKTKQKYQHKIKSIKTKREELKKKKHKISKIRPKLKAELKIRTELQEDEEECSEWEISMPVEEEVEIPVEEPPIVVPETTVVPELNTKCILTVDMLDKDRLRVLTAMGGLFYAGQLTAIQPPDVYAITLDGERGNRPHIMSREEILQNAIVEVSPANANELFPGTRMCAYWSQQYRCLYPGTVAEPGTPDPVLDGKFVCVEFDDGDSGRIAIEDIRLLPSDYPIIEYDPNPLLSLSKRRRRTSVNSSTEERRLNQSNTSNMTTITPLATIPESPKIVDNSIAEKENTDTNKQDVFSHENYHERKKLKKRRKDKLKKLMFKNDKEKKRKHRFCDEHCKHRKHHKKHRKHRKHHHRSGTDSSSTVANDNDLPMEENEVDVDIDTVDEFEEVNGNIIEETNIVHTEIMKSKSKKAKKGRERQESVESRSKMAAFLPARQLWGWSGKGYKRVGIRGRARKQFFKAIQRGKETIKVGDCAVFLSTGRPDRPYIGRIEAMWESWGTNMVVKVKWFYHPEETVGGPLNLQYPGALFESPHIDENDVQTISHKCEVLPLKEYTNKLGSDPSCYESIYENNDIYYLAGYYDPTTTTLTMEPGIPLLES